MTQQQSIEAHRRIRIDQIEQILKDRWDQLPIRLAREIDRALFAATYGDGVGTDTIPPEEK